MRVIGIIGGIASGKTLVAQELRRCGAAIIQADRLGHAVLRIEAVRQAARARWGDEVIGPDGLVDRAAVARRVFAPPPAGPQELAVLESWTHPLIARRIERRLDRLRRQGKVRVVVLDAPVLLKAGWDRLCDALLFVDAPDAIRETRAVARGWTVEALRARQSAQPALSEGRRRADFTVDNGGTLADTRRRVKALWPLLSGERS